MSTNDGFDREFCNMAVCTAAVTIIIGKYYIRDAEK